MKINWSKAANIMGNHLVKESERDSDSARKMQEREAYAKEQGQQRINEMREREKLDAEAATQKRKIDNEEQLGRMAGQLLAENGTEALSKNPDSAHYQVFTGGQPGAEAVGSGIVKPGGDHLTALSSLRGAAERTSEQLKEYGVNVPADVIMRGHLEQTLGNIEDAKKAMKAEQEYRRKRSDRREDKRLESEMDGEERKRKIKELRDAGYSDAEIKDMMPEMMGIKQGQPREPKETEFDKVEAVSAQNRIDTARENAQKAKEKRTPSFVPWGTNDAEVKAAEDEQVAAEAAFEAKRNRRLPTRYESPQPTQQPPQQQPTAPTPEPAKPAPAQAASPTMAQAGTVPNGARTKGGGKFWTLDGGQTFYETETGKQVK